jgi:hypothetical protein
MPKEQSIFEAAAIFDFEVIRTYAEDGNSLNICNNKGHSLLTCFIDGYYTHGDADPEELALYDLHDEFDYDFWDAYVFKIQRTPLEARSSGILEKLEFVFTQGVNPNLCVMVGGATETALMHAVCRHDYYLCKYLLEHGADPGVWLFPKEDYEKRDREYWLMDELDISIMNGDKGEAAAVTLQVAQLLWEYGLRDWSGYCIDIDKNTGVTGGHPMRVLF